MYDPQFPPLTVEEATVALERARAAVSVAEEEARAALERHRSAVSVAEEEARAALERHRSAAHAAQQAAKALRLANDRRWHPVHEVEREIVGLGERSIYTLIKITTNNTLYVRRRWWNDHRATSGQRSEYVRKGDALYADLCKTFGVTP